MLLFALFYNRLLTEEPTKSDFFTTQSENTKPAEIGCFQFEYDLSHRNTGERLGNKILKILI